LTQQAADFVATKLATPTPAQVMVNTAATVG